MTEPKHPAERSPTPPPRTTIRPIQGHSNGWSGYEDRCRSNAAVRDRSGYIDSPRHVDRPHSQGIRKTRRWVSAREIRSVAEPIWREPVSAIAEPAVTQPVVAPKPQATETEPTETRAADPQSLGTRRLSKRERATEQGKSQSPPHDSAILRKSGPDPSLAFLSQRTGFRRGRVGFGGVGFCGHGSHWGSRRACVTALQRES